MTGRIPEPKGLNPADMPWARAVTEFIRSQQSRQAQVDNALTTLSSGQSGIFSAIETQAEQITQVQEDTGTAPDTRLGDPTVPILASTAGTITVTWDGQYVLYEYEEGETPPNPAQIGYMTAEASLTLPAPYDPETEAEGGEPEPDPFVRVGTAFRRGGTQFMGADIGAEPGDTVYVRLRPYKTDGTEGEPGVAAPVILAGVGAGDLDQSINEFLNELEEMAGAAVIDAVDEYATSASSSTAPTSGWSTTPPAWSATNFIWRRVRTFYADGTETLGSPVVLTGNPGTPGADGSPGAPGEPGAPGADATSIAVGNEAVTIATNSSGSTSSAQTITVPFSGWVGNSRVAATAVVSGLPSGITVGTNSPATTSADGSVVLNVANASTLGGANAGEINFAITANGKTFNVKLTWAKSRQGSQGVQGPPGADGTERYTWLKYADTPTSGMSDDPTGKTYIGLAYNKTTPTESSNYSDYTWSLIQGPKGDDGQDGAPGAPGKGVSGTTVNYAKSTNGTTAPSSGWGTSIPATVTGEFLWTRTVTTYTDSTTSTAYSVAAHGATGPQGDPGNTGAPGRGISSTVVNYAKSTNGTTEPSTGWGTTIPATSPGEYLWTRTVITYTTGSPATTTAYAVARHGETGSQGVPGPPGSDGQPTYTWIKYADNASGAGMSDSPTGKAYIGLAHNKTTSTESDTPGDYTWALIKGADGADGADGRGIASTTVTYQASSSGTTTPTGTWNSTVPTVSAGQYLWTRTVITYTSGSPTTAYSVGRMGTNGAQGTPGAPGADGQTSYLHVAYANNATGTSGFSTTDPSGKTYMGTYTDFTEADSTDPSKYDWVLIKGADGSNGANGKGITSSVVEYKAHTSGTSAPTSGWTTTLPSVPAGQYLWTRTTITFSDSATQITYSVARNGTDGANGADGRGIVSTTVTYQASSSGTTAPTGTWSSTVPTVSAGQYLWTRTVVSYTSGSDTTAYSVGRMGTNGAQGTPGTPGADGQTSYLHVAYATNATGTTGFSTTDPTGKTYMGTYTDFTAADSTNPALYDWVLIKGADGTNGSDGAPGAPGTGILSSTVHYQASSSGTVTPTGTWLTTVPTVSAGQYLWTRTVINFTDGGSQTSYSVARTGTNGTNGATVSTITRYYYLTSGSQPAKPTAATPPAPWQTTEPAFNPSNPNDKLYMTDRTVLSNGTTLYSDVTPSAGFEAAKAVYIVANNALDSANGKNKVIWSTSAASGTTGFQAGDTWFQTNSGTVIAQWEFTTSWQPRTLAHQVISSIDAGKISVGYLDVLNRISAGAITADKLLVGDFQNYWNDPDFADPRGYGSWSVVTKGIQASNTSIAAGTYAHTRFPVAAGEQYVVSATLARPTGTTGTAAVYVKWLNASGTQVGSNVTAVALSGAVGSKEGSPITVPSGAVTAEVGFTATLTSGNAVRITDVRIRRMMQGQLIVDGTLAAAKVTPSFGNDLDISANGSINLVLGAANSAQAVADLTAQRASEISQRVGYAQEQAAAAAVNAESAINATEQLGKYYRFSETDLRIGQPGSQVELSVSNTGISFRQNDVAVSLWDGGQMIVKSFIGEEVILVNHKMESRGTRTIVKSM